MRGAEAVVGAEGSSEREPYGFDEKIAVADVTDHVE
jgi:hypothetical protein